MIDLAEQFHVVRIEQDASGQDVKVDRIASKNAEVWTNAVLDGGRPFREHLGAVEETHGRLDGKFVRARGIGVGQIEATGNGQRVGSVESGFSQVALAFGRRLVGGAGAGAGADGGRERDLRGAAALGDGEAGGGGVGTG